MEDRKIILLVEDNERNMRLVTDLLEALGYDVRQAYSGQEGVYKAQKEKPHLILMDIQMAHMDGLTATGILKKDEMTADIPIVAMTAMAMKGDRERILKAGCDDYIAKPVAIDNLIAIVAQWLA